MTGSPALLVWDDRFLEYDFGPGHPFTELSRRLAVRLVEALLPPADRVHSELLWLRESPEAVRDQLLRFHRPEYLDLVERLGRSSAGQYLDQGDTPAFPRCDRAAARIAGGTLAALDALREGRALHAFNPAGGLHHAHRESASGFCIYNDVALAIASAREGGSPLARVAYLDIDVHHGDGVMYGFYGDGRVLDIDFHQDGRTIFPGTGAVGETGTGDGAGLKVNVPLPPGADDRMFAELFGRVVPPLLRDFRPDLIVLQSGVDGHAGDRLGQLQYTAGSYELAYGTLHALAHELCGGRLLATGGGGYAAENVARQLARLALHLSGAPIPSDSSGTLPESWREEFRSTVGYAAPARWNEFPEIVAISQRDVRTARLVDALERHLGRRFPASESNSVPGPTGPSRP
jgi:acetoin utilization protein AcuC